MLALHHLRILQAVAIEGSLSGAARRLHYSQPTITYHLAGMERYFQTRLVDRGSRGAALTEAGVALLPHAEAVLDRLTRAERDVAAVVSGRREP
ncbi:molybdate transport repressor ModE-like protein [Streptacidiphilus sp. MAP12-33]|uniref:LysR family transcriptional regulator n=1 Tax=Streptacidiphilus sp. MAP12-33 TaxID=3156266 RepID=UPI0035190393